jgi:hypothetical protein
VLSQSHPNDTKDFGVHYIRQLYKMVDNCNIFSKQSYGGFRFLSWSACVVGFPCWERCAKLVCVILGEGVLIHPLKLNGRGQTLRLKLKVWNQVAGHKRLGKDVGEMTFTGEKTNFQGFRGRLFSHKVIVYFNMLCACMKDKINHKIGETNFVTMKHRWSREEDAKILYDHLFQKLKL